MALVVKDRVKETTTTTGTGSISLGGAVTKFKTFSSALSDGDTTYYAIEQQGNTNEFEVGIGTYASSGNTLARTTILSSSNSNNAVDFSAGTKNIFMTYPADKAVYEDASGNVSGVGTLNATNVVASNLMQASAITLTGSIGVSVTENIIFEGTTADNYETFFTATDPTADRTITLPDATGTVALTSDINATNVTSAGALMDSEVTNLAQVKAFSSSDYATAAQGSTADAAMPKSGGTFTGDVSFSDNEFLKFGNGDDLWIGHSDIPFQDEYNAITAHSYDLMITNITDDRDVIIRTDDGSGSFTEYFTADGSTGEAKLHYYGTEKIKTTTSGVDISGYADIDNGIRHNGNLTNEILFGSNTQTFKTNGSDRIHITNTGVSIYPSLYANGDIVLTDTNSKITRPASSAIGFSAAGSERARINTSGLDVTGTVTSDGLTVDGNVDLNGTLDLDASPSGYLATFNQGIASATSHGISVSIPANAAHDANILRLNGDSEDKFVVKSSGNVEAKGTITLINTGDDSGRAPDFNLKRDSASPAAWDYLGAVRFLGEDGASNETPYSSILGRIVDPTSGSEDGRLEIWQQKAGTGTLTYVFDHDAFQLQNEQPIKWKEHHGTAYDVFIEPATPTATRTITLPDATGTVLLSDGDGSNLTGVQAASVRVIESSDDNVDYNILFSDTGGGGNVQMAPTQDYSAFTFNPSTNKLTALGTIQSGAIADSDFLFIGYGADTSTEYVGMGVQTGYASITAGGVGSTSTDLRLRTANSGVEADRVIIKADGKTGIGTTSPSEALDVVGNVDIAGRLKITNGSTSSGYIDLLEDSDNGTNKIKLEAPQIIASDKTITLPDRTGEVVVSSGAVGSDATALIGRGKIGYSGTSDVFALSHEDQGTTIDNLGFAQNSSGYSWVNAPSGAYPSLRVNNQNVLAAHASEIIAYQDIKLNTNKNLVFEGATANAFEATVTVTDPTADRTITLPDATGTVTTRAHAVAFANMLG